jgi:lysophosphatidylcholine acyltransferase / lyso-PAF acetyltransferase
LLTQFSNNADVHWLPVYYPSESEKMDPKLYANNVREVLAKALSVPPTNSSFTDKVDYHVAKGYKKASTKKLE